MQFLRCPNTRETAPHAPFLSSTDRCKSLDLHPSDDENAPEKKETTNNNRKTNFT